MNSELSHELDDLDHRIKAVETAGEERQAQEESRNMDRDAERDPVRDHARDPVRDLARDTEVALHQDVLQVLPILPVPVPMQKESRFAVITKFLSWLAAAMFAAAVLMTLVSTTNDRDNLRQELSNQSAELACRFKATTGTATATVAFQAAYGRHNVLLGEFVDHTIKGDRDVPEFQTTLDDIANRLHDATLVLDGSIKPLEDAITAQQDALRACSKD